MSTTWWLEVSQPYLAYLATSEINLKPRRSGLPVRTITQFDVSALNEGEDDAKDGLYEAGECNVGRKWKDVMKLYTKCEKKT